MRVLIPALLLAIAACVPAGAPSGGVGPRPAAQLVSLDGAAFPEPLPGWSASDASTSPAGDGGTVVKRLYRDEAGRTVGITWYLESPGRAGSVRAQANTETGESGPPMVLTNAAQTIDVATDARTVVHLDGTAGLGAQMSYVAVIIGARPASS